MRALAAIATAVALGGALAGCGRDRSAESAQPSPLRPTELRKADCVDWRAATAGERRAAVHALGRYFGRNLPAGSPPQTLPDGDALALLDRVCSHAQTRGFLLWGAYMQAAGFRGYREAYEAGLRRRP